MSEHLTTFQTWLIAGGVTFCYLLVFFALGAIVEEFKLIHQPSKDTNHEDAHR